MSEVVSLHAIEPPRKEGFCPTPTAKKMINVLSIAHKSGFMGTIVGAPGVGKTTAVEHYAKTAPNVTVITISPATASRRSSLQHIAQQIGAATAKDCLFTRNAIREHFKHEVDGGLLVIDEAQHLVFEALEELRHIHDKANLPIVFAGNAQFGSRIKGTAKDAQFAQFTSRIGPRVEIFRPTSGDVEALCEHRGIASRAARDFLQERLVGHGGLRIVDRLIWFARQLAGANTAIELKHLRAAAAAMKVGE